MILTTADFLAGEFKISQDSYTKEDLALALTDFEEEKVIKEVLGITLGDLFIADLEDGEPQSEIYTKIFNPFIFEYEDCLLSTKGLKYILQSSIFLNYTSIQAARNMAIGTVIQKGEGTTASASIPNAVRYNKMVDDIHNLRTYLILNKTDYPDFNFSKVKYYSFNDAV